MSEDSKKSKSLKKWLKAKFFGAVDNFEKKHKDKDIRPFLEKAVKDFERSLEGEVIPSGLTRLPPGDPEQEIIAIHLRPGCFNNSEMTQIQSGAAKALVHKFLEINGMMRAVAQQSGIIRDKVSNQGEYAFLYAGLSPDVEILEIQYFDTGRIFGFFTQSTFNVVCIRTAHIENH
jgi:hypothetical protein